MTLSNQRQLPELLTFLDFAEDFAIGLVSINPQDIDALTETLKEHPTCKHIQFDVMNFDNPQLRFLMDAIAPKLSAINVEGNKKLVLILRGLEESIGMAGEYPPVLQDLNFVRDAFLTRVPHPIIFCLPDYAITRLALFAPDFWAWSSAVFDFNANLSDLKVKEFARWE